MQEEMCIIHGFCGSQYLPVPTTVAILHSASPDMARIPVPSTEHICVLVPAAPMLADWHKAGSMAKGLCMWTIIDPGQNCGCASPGVGHPGRIGAIRAPCLLASASGPWPWGLLTCHFSAELAARKARHPHQPAHARAPPGIRIWDWPQRPLHIPLGFLLSPALRLDRFY